MLVLGVVADGETRSFAAFQRPCQAASDPKVARSSFYDRFTPASATCWATPCTRVSGFHTGNWLCSRLFLFDLGFYSYRRFALIDENDGYLTSRLNTNANPALVDERRKWLGHAIF